MSNSANDDALPASAVLLIPDVLTSYTDPDTGELCTPANITADVWDADYWSAYRVWTLSGGSALGKVFRYKSGWKFQTSTMGTHSPMHSTLSQAADACVKRALHSTTD